MDYTQYEKMAKRILNEDSSYSNYLDTNYSADGQEDAAYERKMQHEMNKTFENGKVLFQAATILNNNPNTQKLAKTLYALANKYRNNAIEQGKYFEMDPEDWQNYEETLFKGDYDE